MPIRATTAPSGENVHRITLAGRMREVHARENDTQVTWVSSLLQFRVAIARSTYFSSKGNVWPRLTGPSPLLRKRENGRSWQRRFEKRGESLFRLWADAFVYIQRRLLESRFRYFQGSERNRKSKNMTSFFLFFPLGLDFCLFFICFIQRMTHWKCMGMFLEVLPSL